MRNNSVVNIDNFERIETEQLPVSKVKLNILPGMHDISIENYHHSNGISRSGMMDFIKTPYHYWANHINPDKPVINKDSKALLMGDMIHLFLLEKPKFDENYLIAKKMDKRTKAGQNYYQTLDAIKGNRTLINEQEFELVESICKSLLKNKTAVNLLEGAQIEKSFYWSDPHSGILCKARPDIWQPNFICDLKSTACASLREFQNSMYKYGYYLQCAFICEAFRNVLNIDMRDFIFICVEKEYPFAHAIYKIDEFTLDKGIEIFKNKLLELKQCYETNTWESYKTQIITLPNYALGDL